VGTMHATESDFQQCRSILRRSSKTFFLASKVLPKGRERAFWAVYSFCRSTDDIADEDSFTQKERAEKLGEWKKDMLAAYSGKRSSHPAMRAFADTALHYGIPISLPLKLIQGVSMDISRTRFSSFGTLRRYCYCVASVVGLMLLHVMGVKSRRAKRYAIFLGIAMQLTNILRDIAEDLRMGRVYLPEKELAAYGLKQSDISLRMGVRKAARFRRFLQFQVRRARHYYRQAVSGIEMLPRELRLAIASAASLYSKILDRMEKQNYEVFIAPRK